MSTKRDNAYYENRLRNEHPSVYQDFRDGKISLREALVNVGLRKRRTRMHELVNAWNQATLAEQDDFLRKCGLSRGISKVGSGAGLSTIHHAGNLTADGRDAIRLFMDNRGFGDRTGEIMKLLGRKPLVF